MSITARLRALGETPGRPFNEAFEMYAKASSAPTGVKANPLLYGDLTRHYLLWSAGLLTRMEEAAAARPDAGPLVEPLLDRVGAYFDTESRWPATPHLGAPARTLVPAYYAVRAAQRVNAHAQPHLVDVAFDEPHAFAIEVLGHAVSELVCAHKNADLRELPEVPEASTPVEPLTYRSFLHASHRSKLEDARTPPPPAVVPPPSPPEPPVSQDEMVSLRWTRALANSRIVLEQSNDFDRSGIGSSFSQRERFLYLLDGGRYRLVEKSLSRVSYAGLTVGGPSTRESEGIWAIRVTAERASLLLKADGGGIESYSLAERRKGVLAVDGRDRAWTGV